MNYQDAYRPYLTPKPRHYEFSDLVAGLPTEMKSSTIHLLLWIYRHTNADRANENFGKAWMSHANIAREMHLGKTAIQEAFNDAWAWGAISREHLFKKNGEVIVSTAPYHPRKSKGLGEYLGCRYWLNWDFLQEIQVGVSENDALQNKGIGEIGLSESNTPNQIGLSESAIPMSESDTKGLIEPFLSAFEFKSASTLDCDGTVPAETASETPSGALSSGEARGEAGEGTTQETSDTRQIQNLVVVAAGGGEKSQVKGWGVAPEASQGLRPDTLLGEVPPRPCSFESQNPAQGEQEARIDRIIASARQRQLDRKKSQAEIIREYEAVFNRVAAEAGKPYSKGQRDITLEYGSVFRTNAPHRKEAAELYRTLGHEETLARWEAFLVNDDHMATEAEWIPYSLYGDEPEKGRWAGNEIQRTWLLHDFVMKYGDKLEANRAA